MKRVLVVDDDEDMRELVRILLRGKYEVTSAQDGAEGLERALLERPDLVVLDLLMPKMHGFEVCRRLRADPSLGGTGILIMSSKSYPHDIRTAIEEAGADDYIVKPFENADFQARVAAVLGKR